MYTREGRRMSKPGAQTPAQGNANTVSGLIRVAIVAAVVTFVLLELNAIPGGAASDPPSPVPQQVVQVNPRPEEIRFQNGECYPALVKLAGHWFVYPIGGPVNFYDEHGNLAHTSVPGNDRAFVMNDGWYRLCPREKQTKGVDIVRQPW